MTSRYTGVDEVCECEKPMTSAVYETKDYHKLEHLFSCVCQLLFLKIDDDDDDNDDDDCDIRL